MSNKTRVQLAIYHYDEENECLGDMVHSEIIFPKDVQEAHDDFVRSHKKGDTSDVFVTRLVTDGS